ncbi:SMC-Scp complex subunit ScpB [Eubacteriales bacterium OttesenSCG-928-K08]|nr:SMC-Scp complex subunit ScpB [Eubacteriales bacterium OttesenSCG-928-K08]
MAQDLISAIECMLFVAGDPVALLEIERVLNISAQQTRELLNKLQNDYKQNNRGILLCVTDTTAQLCSNPEYSEYVEQLLQPAEKKTFSQSLLETLSVVAYRQPVTRADIEAVRGVRCEYAVSQLVKMNMIQSMGRKEVVGRPVLYGTTDAFLRHFGIGGIRELPDYDSYAKGEDVATGILNV